MASSHRDDENSADADANGKNSKTTTGDSKGRPNRRSFLKMGATAAGAAAVGSAAGRSKAAVTHHGITFDNVLDAVNDLGVDATGGNAVDSAVKSAMADDTLIEFPPGTYLWTEEHDYLDRRNVGIRSTTGNPDDVTFVFPQGFREVFMAIKDGSQNVLLEGFEVAQTADQDTGIGIVVRADDGIEVHNISFTGFSPENKPSNQLYATIETVDGVGTIDGVTIDGGGVVDTYPHRMTGIFGGTPHIGELYIRNCDIRELGSSGVRYTGGTGAVKVENCYFENIDNAALRIHGNDHDGGKQSWAKGCEFVNDDSLVEHLPSGENYENADMIRADGAGNAYSGLLIENCTFKHFSDPDGTFSRGCICRPGWGNHGGMTVRDCTMRLDDDGAEAIDAKHSSSGADNAVLVENTHVTGTLNSTASGSIMHIGDSDGSAVSNCCISVPNAEDGILIEDSSNCSVESSDIDVPGQATKFVNSSVSTSGITSDGACRLPGDGSSDDGSSDDGSSGDTSTDYRSLGITGKGTPTNYTFTVSGELKSDDLESWDDITGSTAEGWVTEDTQSDTFDFTGEVTDFEFLEGDATVTVDGSEVDPSSLGYETLKITGKGTATNYKFTVSGSLSSDNLEKWDDITDSTAEGWVTEDTQSDTFDFTGEVTDFEFLEGDATVELNGTEIDPSSYWQTLDRELTVIADAETVTDYTFSVDGDVEPVTDGDMPAGDFDNVTADGDLMVVDGVTSDAGGDRWKFSGEVVDLTLEAEGAAYIDGTQVDPAKVGTDETEAFPHHILFDGAASTDVCEYEFAVSGAVAKSPDLGSMEAAEELTDGVVTGSVAEDTDGFRFSGSLTSLELDGTADVTFE